MRLTLSNTALVCGQCVPQLSLPTDALGFKQSKRESTPRFIYQSLPTPGSGISSLTLSYDSSKFKFSCPITRVELPIINFQIIVVVVVQSLSRVQLCATPWTAARQASLSFTVPCSLLKLMSIESVSHPTISSSVSLFSSCLQSFPASGSFPRISSSHQVAKVLELQLQHQSFQ